ncbi:MAG: 3-phosphoshikimate 1-carboxyvinyltransferase [Deltaproteobacteria bacterium]
MNRMGGFEGTVAVPGDKSISHRAVILASLANGKSRIRNFLPAEDTRRTVAMMRALGVPIEEAGPAELRIEGVGLRGLSEPEDVLDAGNSGTTIRIGSGLLAAQPFLSIVTGDRYLRKRPMGRIVEPLVRMGARIAGRRGDTLPPLCIRGGALSGIRHEMPVASAQVKSALLLAGLFAESTVTVVEPLPSRDHTERMLRAMGVPVRVEGGEISVDPAESLSPLDLEVPGDLSAAAFFLALAAGSAGSVLRIPSVGVNPGRTGIVQVLRRMGAGVSFGSPRERAGEPVADLVVEGKELAATTIEPEEVPSLIDEIPALCAAAAMAAGRTTIRGAAELRVKESDRIGAMTAALTAMGVECGEFADGLWIEGPARIREGALCDSRGDHRIAMAVLTLAAAAGVPVRVTDTACIATSFPGFETRLREVLR